MSKYMNDVIYLEVTDFNSDGSLKPSVTNGKPVVVGVMASWCGHCNSAKPAVQQTSSQFKNQGNAVFAIIMTDGDTEQEKQAGKLMSDKFEVRGFPTFCGFDKNGKFVKQHEGGRDVGSFVSFASSL